MNECSCYRNPNTGKYTVIGCSGCPIHGMNALIEALKFYTKESNFDNGKLARELLESFPK